MDVPQFNYTSLEGHLGRFCFLVLQINLLWAFMCRFLFESKFLFSGINAQEYNYCCIFCGLINCQTLFWSGCVISHFHQWYMRNPASLQSHQHLMLSNAIFYFSCCDMYIVISHCISPMANDVNIFSCICHLCILLGNMSFHNFCSFLSFFQSHILYFIFLMQMLFSSFFNLIKNTFHWSKIALQYYVGFCHTSHESAIGTCISPSSWTSLPPTTPPPPSRLLQSTRFELSESYSKFPMLSVLHMVMSHTHTHTMYTFQVTVSMCPSLSFPCCVYTSVLSVSPLLPCD